jgi:hypothetical protein
MDKTQGADKAAQTFRLAGRAQNSALRIMALHAPHINEEEDAPMDAMEASIKDLAASVDADLAALGSLVPGSEELGKAKADFAAFMEATGEVLRLSRLNSRYQAMALIFGTKRRAESLCEDTLAALRVHLQNKAYKATR